MADFCWLLLRETPDAKSAKQRTKKSIKGKKKWAHQEIHFRNIHFNFCPLNDQALHDKTLKARFEQGMTIKNTRQYHCFEPVNNKILCRLFSKM